MLPIFSDSTVEFRDLDIEVIEILSNLSQQEAINLLVATPVFCNFFSDHFHRVFDDF